MQDFIQQIEQFAFQSDTYIDFLQKGGTNLWVPGKPFIV